MSYLGKPIVIGAMTLKNRLVMPPMATSKAHDDGSITQDILDYYEEKSSGGDIGLIIIEHSYVSLDGKASEQQMSVADDQTIIGLKKLADIVHQDGSRAVMQISHAGSAASPDVIKTTPVGPSPIANPRRGIVPRELSKTEILDIVDCFVNAARRVHEAGFDGVEIHSAHGYLLNQFWSPLTNQRTDEYGGDINNRIRVHLQIIEGIRSVVDSDFSILLRLGVSDFTVGGTTVEDSKKVAPIFEKAGVDALDISGGLSGYNVPGLNGQGYFAPYSQEIKSAVAIPIIVTGGVTSPSAAEELLTEEKADLIGVGRAILGDSGWAQRALAEVR